MLTWWKIKRRFAWGRGSVNGYSSIFDWSHRWPSLLLFHGKDNSAQSVQKTFQVEAQRECSMKCSIYNTCAAMVSKVHQGSGILNAIFQMCADKKGTCQCDY